MSAKKRKSFEPSGLDDCSMEAKRRRLLEPIGLSDELSPRSLKMIMGGFYVPKENPEKPLGEDAHFILQKSQTFGLADGVGGWSKKGIDGGQYARELMENALDAVQDQPAGCVDPTVILEEAFLKTDAKGSSTACIITLKGEFLHAVNLGDSGFMVIRDGEVVFETKPQQHYFNCPYQLGRSWGMDTPSSADEIFVPVEAGDVVVAGTDGLFDNVYPSEILDLVEICLKQDNSPMDTAWNLAKVAMSQSLCEFTISPFTKNAMEAGLEFSRFKGGKYDDITVVVAHVV